MRTILISLIALMSSCSIFNDRLDVDETDLAVTLVEIEVDASNLIPGAPAVDADGCMLILRNAVNQSEKVLGWLLTTLTMETGDCKIGKSE